MKTSRLTHTILIFFTASTMLFSQNTTIPFQKAIKKSQKIINKLIKKKKIPGIAITITQNEKTIWEQGYGFANIQQEIPVNPQKTIFRIASVSKPIAATALAKMVADSIINLDQSVYHYIPYFPKKKYDITIRQLGGHLAGIRPHTNREFLNNKPLSIKEGINFFKDDSLLFQPNTNYQYTSFDWNLISLAIQEISGVPFEEYVQKHILEPLEMTNTFPDTIIPNPNIASFYSKSRMRKFRIATPVNNFYKLAGGGYLSTSNDVVKLGNAYLQNNFLPKEITAEFLTAQKIANQSTHYGIGFQVSFDNKNRPFYGHVGNGVGASSIFYIYPNQKMVFSILINMTQPKVDKKLHKIIDYFLEVVESSQ